MNFFQLLKSDYKKNHNNVKALFIIFSYRAAHFCTCNKKNVLIFVIGFPIRLFYKLTAEWVMGVEIPSSVVVGHSFCLHHCQSLVMNSLVKIGNNVTIKHNTTIGASIDKQGKSIKAPVIGNNVLIHPHCIIFGDIMIGDNSIIGAGSVVFRDVPKNCIVAGNPARIIKQLATTDLE
jgi:putative colanic acid biosynthesis acetyltransferase WcaB